MWLARDNDYSLWLFNEKPKLCEWLDGWGQPIACWEISELDYSEHALELPRALFQNVTFENSPIKVKLKTCTT